MSIVNEAPDLETLFFSNKMLFVRHINSFKMVQSQHMGIPKACKTLEEDYFLQ
jgi:hypothetical protein